MQLQHWKCRPAQTKKKHKKQKTSNSNIISRAAPSGLGLVETNQSQGPSKSMYCEVVAYNNNRVIPVPFFSFSDQSTFDSKINTEPISQTAWKQSDATVGTCQTYSRKVSVVKSSITSPWSSNALHSYALTAVFALLLTMVCTQGKCMWTLHNHGCKG